MLYLSKISQLDLYLIFALVVLFFLLIFQIIFFTNKIRNLKKNVLKKSRAIIGGQVSEQIAPYLPNFPCKASEVKFLGKPVDFIAFTGLDQDCVDEILLIEVKTGKSNLSYREKQVQKAVEEGRVRYVEYRI